jgi:hypothetical protein
MLKKEFLGEFVVIIFAPPLLGLPAGFKYLVCNGALILFELNVYVKNSDCAPNSKTEGICGKP